MLESMIKYGMCRPTCISSSQISYYAQLYAKYLRTYKWFFTRHWLPMSSNWALRCNSTPNYGIPTLSCTQNFPVTVFIHLLFKIKKINPLYLLSTSQECCMRSSCMSVCLSVCLCFTISQERLDVECWNLALMYSRSRVASSLKMGHVHDLWPRQIEYFHKAHLEFM